jgi:hypothetical protein
MKTNYSCQIKFFRQAFLLAASLTLILLQIAPTAQAASLNHNPTLAPNPILGNDQPVRDLNPRLIASDEQGITLELSRSEFEIEQKVIDGKTCQVISIAGYGVTDQPGQAELPVRGAMLGIPVLSDPTLEIIQAKSVTLPGKYQLCTTETPILDLEIPGNLAFEDGSMLQDSEVTRLVGFQPSEPAELSETAFLRSQRIAQIRLYPFQYNAISGELRYYELITARLVFNVETSSPELSVKGVLTSVPEGAFESILQDSLLNYEQAYGWRAANQNGVSVQTNQITSRQPSYKVMVNQDSFYQITYEALVEIAGEDLSSIQPSGAFQLFAGGDYTYGQEVAIEVFDDDGVFGQGDYLLFYGQKADTRYSDTSVYYLTWGSNPGRRAGLIDSAPTGDTPIPYFKNTIRLEKNSLYMSNYPSGAIKDVWYWDYIQNSGLKTFYFTTETAALDATLTATVRGVIQSYSGGQQHHTQIFLNGNLIDDTLWRKGDTYFFETEVPQSYLIQGQNTITVQSLLDNGITSGIVLINWFEIDFWSQFIAQNDSLMFLVAGDNEADIQVSGFSSAQVDLFDITDPHNIARLINISLVQEESDFTLEFTKNSLEDRLYFAQSPAALLDPLKIESDRVTNLRSSHNAADYLIITHANFIDEVQPLADWRSEHGLRSMVIDVADIYDEFSGGVMSAEAIRDFLAYAYVNWQRPAPLYVLLVGDGHYDPRNYLGTGTPTFIPPYLDFVDRWLGMTASENRFVAISGEDYLPDMHIGRIPVTNRSQASAVVSKILAYEQNQPATDWNSNVLFIADNPDSGGNFPAYSNIIIDNFLPAAYTAKRIYYGSTHTTVTSTRAAILDSINSGALIVNYVGHGAVQSWASENFFSVNSIPSLTNTDRLPMVASFSCLSSSFHYPTSGANDPSALTEKLILSANNGAIATFGSAGMGLASGQDYLNRGLYNAIFSENVTRAGAAATHAKLYVYATTGAYQDLIDNYTFLGDPATLLKVMPDPERNNLSYLDAEPGPALVEISWATESDIGNLGFNIYQAQSLEGSRQKINAKLIPPQSTVTLSNGSGYSFIDTATQPGLTYFYWIELVYTGGNAFSENVSATPNWALYLPMLQRK